MLTSNTKSLKSLCEANILLHWYWVYSKITTKTIKIMKAIVLGMYRYIFFHFVFPEAELTSLHWDTQPSNAPHYYLWLQLAVGAWLIQYSQLGLLEKKREWKIYSCHSRLTMHPGSFGSIFSWYQPVPK